MNFINDFLIFAVAGVFIVPQTSGQGIRFDRYPNSKWPNGIIPYVLNPLNFTLEETAAITLAMTSIDLSTCVKFVPRLLQADYIEIFKGRGCYSSLGRRGGSQPLSLGAGCYVSGTILRQLMHAIGFQHEQNRLDRDDFVQVLWNNIPPRWRSQYRKQNPNDYGLQASYDYYSILHYPMKAPGTNRDAFRIKQDGIDPNLIGNGRALTETDKLKVNILYGCA